MKQIVLIVVLLTGMAHFSFAAGGYRIHLSIPSVKDSVAYLVHYYGKSLPTIYKRDSAKFDKNGHAEFSTNDSSFVGGIYMILLSDRKTYFEFLLKKGDNITIEANINDLPQDVTFKNSPENVDFQEYVHFLKNYSKTQQAMQQELKGAKTAGDTTAVRRKYAGTSRKLTDYRREYVSAHPKTLLATIFNALDVPQVPEGDNFLEDGKTIDSTFGWQYYKSHYWDKFDLQDDRLIHTPIFDAKLDEYFSKWVIPSPDSIEHEADVLLRKSRGTEHLFKYTLFWLTRYVQDSKIMGMDEVFVYLVENYYMKGDAVWLRPDELGKYIDRARHIAPNVIGNLAPEIKLPAVGSRQPQSLMELKAKYTVLVFYSPSCSHCQKELPGIDSAYKAILKAKGVKVYTVATEGTDSTIAAFIKQYKLEEFTNTSDQEHVSDWRNKYDVYSTPSIYLLDEKKIIRGKRLDHTNIAGLVNMLDKKEKANKTKTNN